MPDFVPPNGPFEFANCIRLPAVAMLWFAACETLNSATDAQCTSCQCLPAVAWSAILPSSPAQETFQHVCSRIRSSPLTNVAPAAASPALLPRSLLLPTASSFPLLPATFPQKRSACDSRSSASAGLAGGDGGGGPCRAPGFSTSGVVASDSGALMLSTPPPASDGDVSTATGLVCWYWRPASTASDSVSRNGGNGGTPKAPA